MNEPMENYSDPLQEIFNWVERAQRNSEVEPTAMCLSTLSEEGFPDSRMVLLKGRSAKGLRFFTNLQSPKAKQIQKHPQVSLNFFFPIAFEQIRVLGRVYALSVEESTEYFQSRPRISQISAWASPQSQPIESRGQLEKLWEAMEQKFVGLDPLPKPDNWGGYEVIPHQIEFWRGREGRFHDRVRYVAGPSDGVWMQQRLCP